jgi:hypothetical protein
VLWLLSGLSTPIPQPWRYAVVVIAAVLGALRDTGRLTIPLPQNARQIPQHVLQRHLVRGTWQFGFELGTGVRTYVSASAPYVMATAVLMSAGSYPAALATGLGFGVGRALTPIVRRLSGTPDDWDDRLARRLTAQSVLACVLIAAAFALLA